MKALIHRIRLFFDPTREPLRRRVYAVLAAIVSAAVTAGVITGTAGVAITGIASAVLVGAVAEQVRSLVTPVAAPVLDDEPGKHTADRSP